MADQRTRDLPDSLGRIKKRQQWHLKNGKQGLRTCVGGRLPQRVRGPNWEVVRKAA